jgi:uncharacterized protein (DUF433 family)
MQKTNQNILSLGNGIYTVPDMARILGLPYYKVNEWLNEYWDGKLGKAHQSKYSWRIDNTRAVNFHTLIEFYVMAQFGEAGVKTKNVLLAHEELAARYSTAYPFAVQEVLENMGTDGKHIYLNSAEGTIELNGKKQFHLEYIRSFLLKLDFNEQLASRLWPLGKNKSVVCDPHHKFGQPVIDGTNIQTEVIYQMYLAKEPLSFIASLYELPVKKVKEAIAYHQMAA